ncbi:MATE family efflux transporter [Rubellimicrobium aerolatum]|uniref:Multidrug-efflux transporter n=1 Tax=Rubellimicrobium aerolatum TaxID=490979 RepID=A0ABW0S908_9RHOB|nr:MATE family efflux transporter [Rubellimicrobium aerolatum]MBP1804763.1 MATE family multidrug resistance protein [Rubellimicrobium aerolatum]
MTQTPTLAPARPGWSGHARGLLALAVPLIGSNLAGFAIHLTDIVLLGWYGVTELAAITLASSLWYIVFLMGSGFGIAVMPLAATAREEGDLREVRRATRMGLWLSMGYAALFLPVLLWSGLIFSHLGQEPAIADLAGRYLGIAGWGLIPTLMIAVLRSFLSALERAGVLMWATIAAALLNALWGYALIFGAWGLPELGIEGAAWAALGTQTLTAAALWAYALGWLPDYRLLQRWWRPDWAAMGRVFRLGWPIGGQLLAEVGLFAGSSVMMGWVGEVALAAHGVALQMASATFMLHLGLSQAVTVRAGQALGRSDREGLRQGALVAIALSAGFAVLASTGFLLAPGPLLSLFVDPADPAAAQVIAVGAGLLAFAALFQIFDGMQVLAMGLLRGLHDTTVPMILAALSYWAIGLPVAYVLGFALGWGAAGVWLGLVTSLVAASALLMARFWRRASRPLTGLHA